MKKAFAIFLAFAIVASASARDIVRSIQKDLTYDENGKLAKHHLLFPAGNHRCDPAKIGQTYGFEFRAVADEALAAVFPGASEGDCVAVCLERGTDKSVAHAAMPERHWLGEGDFRDWFENTCKKTEVCLMNYHSRETPIKVYWISPTGEKKFHMELQYGERGTRCFSSFLGHKFEVEDGVTGELLRKIKVEFISTIATGVSPPSGDPEMRDFEWEIERTLHNEWRRHNRVTRTFSPLGFKKGRLPEDLFASMGAFYYNNRNHKVREEWNGKGVFVNWWETDCSFIQIPWNQKGTWQERLRLLVEAWAGVPVEQTDMYGLRQYEHGARLLTHVDREATHAVSLIVNIAQGNMTEPWPVEVNDHNDRLHEVIMEPGDVVYYESAKCLHGRNRPLTGPDAFYTNLFTHYRPVGDPKWFEKPNHEGVPDPVLDVEGDCRLEKVKTSETSSNQLGVVEAVKCDDPRLGSYVSPALFKAASAEDLIEWWRMTSPPEPSQSTDATDSGRDEL
ncbi:2OG-Fe(II) oxygenase [Seminavis robusta]|uniref:2OG-Fe(II) oxygenase n=1 Tax=Seminavis robusta TaxID=568900 RepID=A0A9N8HNF0_9STRA|nr:2OG-Fe(II) oxygenase [Seminavis robusta]|eukprot:Sro988_g228420.1 2OG-Fe(II) oxygenase (506) ;mRNA; f:28322-29917